MSFKLQFRVNRDLIKMVIQRGYNHKIQYKLLIESATLAKDSEFLRCVNETGALVSSILTDSTDLRWFASGLRRPGLGGRIRLRRLRNSSPGSSLRHTNSRDSFPFAADTYSAAAGTCFGTNFDCTPSSADSGSFRTAGSVELSYEATANKCEKITLLLTLLKSRPSIPKS